MLDGTLAIPSLAPQTRQPDEPFKSQRGPAEPDETGRMLAVIAAAIDEQPSAVCGNCVRSIAIWLHLLSIGTVAAVTVAAFFGIGFGLLLQEARGSRGPVAVAAVAAPGAVPPSRQSTVQATPAANPPAAVTATVVKIPQAIAPSMKFAATYRSLPEHAAEPTAGTGSEATDANHGATQASLTQIAAPPVEPPPTEPEKTAAAAAPPQPQAQAPGPIGAPARVAAKLSAAEVAALLARGDQFLRAGDVASARLFYERAADAGDGQAALREAATFDPAFLANAGLRGTLGDPASARWWYARAHQSEPRKESR